MSPSANDFFGQLQDVFLSETGEHVSTLEELFLAFEKDPVPGAVLDQIFRIVHTIKGSANSVGFEQLGSFAHVVEDLLVKVRRGDVAVTRDVMTTLLQANDKLAESVKSLRQDRASQCDSGAIEESINRIFKVGISAAEAEALKHAGNGDIVFMDSPTTDCPCEERQPQEAGAPRRGPTRIAGRQSAIGEEYLRVPLAKIDTILNFFGEQVILQSGLEHLKRDIENEQARSTITQLGKVTYELQQLAMSLRMVSLKSFFGKMERVVRDTADHVRKPVAFVRHGEGTELDKTIVDELQAVIPHLIRNAVDHGLEDPEGRRRAGKAPEGKVELTAFHEGGFFFLRVADDGRGLDRARILEIGRAQGLIDDPDPSDADVFNLIFLSGFSTREKATDISGRGIGMDAVKSSVEAMRGSLSVQSEPGKGTQFTIKLPLSMAIFNGMIFNVGESRYVLPSSRILDVHRFRAHEIRAIDKMEKVLLKGAEKLPFITLADVLKVKSRETHKDRQIAFVIESRGRRFALGVDAIVGQSRIVQKKIGTELDNLAGVSGGAILGDGQIALILNLDELLRQ